MLRIIIPTLEINEKAMNARGVEMVKSILKSSDVASMIHVVPGNKTGLSKLYNNFLDLFPDDILLFIHDDVEIHDHFLVKKLVAAHEKFDIVGLAGATDQDYSKPYPAWHLCKSTQQAARGFVSHYVPKGFQGVAESHFNSSYFGGTPGQVVVLDGLFLSVDAKKVREKLNGKPLFDDEFEWHHYDMAMACNAKANGISLGTWPIFCIHHGLGDSMYSDDWKMSASKFNQKFKDVVL